MLIHIALFGWKDGVTEEEVGSVLELIKSLKNKCDGVVDIFCGKNYHKEAKGFTHGVVVLAESQEALDGYRQHPDHAIVAEKVEVIEEDGIGFDFKDIGL